MLQGIGLVGAASAVGLGAAATAPNLFANDGTFAVSQDGWCIDCAPIETKHTAEEFYGYRKNPSSYDRRVGWARTKSNIGRDNVSSLFLYKGPKGLSLGVLHERFDADSGFDPSAWMQFVGLPSNGSWVVMDDPEDFESTGDGELIRWSWTDGESDGGMFRGGLGGEFEIVVEPLRFSGIDEWRFIYGDPWAYSIIRLDPSRPVTIRTGDCPKDTLHRVDRKVRKGEDRFITPNATQTPGVITPGEDDCETC